ncbi:hypothetical protein OF83DRAFT_1080870 [Amylostereum chailletii]|nr:hypothetical protein OF83DRAFT_1080870 [Amylostereum chailletii]
MTHDSGTGNSSEDSSPSSIVSHPAIHQVHNGAPSPDDFTHSQDFWFADGSLIIICESTGFRVHAGILSLHCSVFRDMTCVGNPSGDRRIDGAAVVALDDTANDMACFLKALYFRREGPMRAKLPVRELGALLRLARKYMADSLQEETLEHLTILFPSTLESYRSSQRHLPLPPVFNPLEGVKIALDLHAPIILPAALYSSALLDPDSCDFYKKADVRVMRAIMVFHDRHTRNIFDMVTKMSYFRSPKSCYGKGSDGCKGVSQTIGYTIIDRYRALDFDIFKDRFVDQRSDAFWEDNKLCKECAGKLEPTKLANRLWEEDLPTYCVDRDWEDWEDVEAVA